MQNELPSGIRSGRRPPATARPKRFETAVSWAGFGSRPAETRRSDGGRRSDVADGSRIGIIGGGGWLGGAIARGILDAALVPAADLTLSYRSREPDGFAGVHLTSGNEELIERSDIVIVSVDRADRPALVLSAPGRLVDFGDGGDRHRRDPVAAARPPGRPHAAQCGRRGGVRSYTPWRAAAGSPRRIVPGSRRSSETCGSADEVADESRTTISPACRRRAGDSGAAGRRHAEGCRGARHRSVGRRRV